MDDRLILVLDEGTTSTRALLFAADGRVMDTARRDLGQYYPRPGWVEQDPAEIWEHTLACARAMVERAGGPQRIAAIGIANQRETVVAWDRRSGQPLARAIVWQDRRTANACLALKEAGHEERISQVTGLLLDPYFSATKMRWLLDHEPAVAAAGDALAFGTVESWLTFKLTGGLHVTDASNASRTLLMPLDRARWDDGLCDLFGVDPRSLPEIVDMAGAFGATSPELFGAPIPICGLAGDQQAATIGQACLAPGDTKATFGTGAFILTATGDAAPRSRNRLLATVLTQIDGQRSYALEGSVFVAGSMVQWLRDGLGWLASAAESEAVACSVSDSGGVTVVPALAGLGAPHWRPDVRGAIFGLTLGTTRAQVIRAALESIAHQCFDLQQAFAADGHSWTRLRIDGGMSANDWLAQDLADMVALPVERPDNVESTARGAAMLAAVGAGLYPTLDQATSAMIPNSQCFVPAMGEVERQRRLSAWDDALRQVLDPR